MMTDLSKMRRHNNKGFTIIEVMVVIAVIGTLIGVAVTYEQLIVVEPQLAVKEVMAHIRRARTEAIRLEETATVAFFPGLNGGFTYTLTNSPLVRTYRFDEEWRKEIGVLPNAPAGDLPAAFVFSFSPRGVLVPAPGACQANPIIYITDDDGFADQNGKHIVYRIRATMAGTIEGHLRNFDQPAWGEIR